MAKQTIEAFTKEQAYELISALLDVLKDWDEDLVRRWIIEAYPETEESL